jgi:hypothetical protein
METTRFVYVPVPKAGNTARAKELDEVLGDG